MSAIRERICQFLDLKNISKREFARKTKISANYLSFDSEIKSDILLKIFNCFPELSITWLLSGEGDMLNKNQAHNPDDSKNFNYLIETNKNLSESNRQLSETNAQLVKKIQEDAGVASADTVLVTEGRPQKNQKH